MFMLLVIVAKSGLVSEVTDSVENDEIMLFMFDWVKLSMLEG